MPTQITGATGATPTAGTQAKNPKATLGKDDFLKLFIAQMQHQDPSKPMDDTAMMAQMSSFSTLEQMTNMASANAQIAQAQAQSNAVGLIGRTVSYVDAAGAEHSGAVETVTTAGGQSVLTVAGVANIDPKSVTQVS